MSLEIFSEITASFLIANIVSELIKYVAVKVFVKIDRRVDSFLD